MDIRDLKFEDGSFDVAIDKGRSLRGSSSSFEMLKTESHPGRNYGHDDDSQRRCLGKFTGSFLASDSQIF